VQTDNGTRSGIEPDRRDRARCQPRGTCPTRRSDRVGAPRARRLLGSEARASRALLSPAGPRSSLASPASIFAQAGAGRGTRCMWDPALKSAGSPTAQYGPLGEGLCQCNGTVSGRIPHFDTQGGMLRKRAHRENRRSAESRVGLLPGFVSDGIGQGMVGSEKGPSRSAIRRGGFGPRIRSARRSCGDSSSRGRARDRC